MSYFLVTNDPNTKLTRGTCAGAAGPPWLLNGESRKAVAVRVNATTGCPQNPKAWWRNRGPLTSITTGCVSQAETGGIHDSTVNVTDVFLNSNVWQSYNLAY